jgi:hypothetical protein
MRWIALVTSISIAAIAAWYSIVGLMAIFAGATFAIAVMGGVLEVGKLVTAAWLHANWREAPWLMKSYLTLAVLVLMVITSLGIFGFLSKAHLEHSISSGGNNELQIENLQRKIRVEQRSIEVSETVLSQLDATVQTLIDYDRIRGKDGAVETRKAQAEERNAENQSISDAYDSIERLQSSLSPLQRERLELEVEVGPLKYIAELVYGEEEAANYFDEAVRGVIILIIVCFDPLAVVLLLAASMGFKQRRASKFLYEDGNFRVDPNNVSDVESSLDEMTAMAQAMGEYESPFDNPLVSEPDIPEDDDIEDYEVITPERPKQSGRYVKEHK